MKSLVESLFDTYLVTKDPVITTCADANEAVVGSLEGALHMKAQDAMKKDLTKTLWIADKWTLVDCFEPKTNVAAIYMQYNKSYIPDELKTEKEVEFFNMPIRIRIDIFQSQEMIYIHNISCELLEDLDFQMESSVKGTEILNRTGLKNRFFRSADVEGIDAKSIDSKNTTKILKYLDNLFVNFKKSIIKGEFDEVFRYIYLINHTVGGQKYSGVTRDALNKIFNKLIK